MKRIESSEHNTLRMGKTTAETKKKCKNGKRVSGNELKGLDEYLTSVKTKKVASKRSRKQPERLSNVKDPEDNETQKKPASAKKLTAKKVIKKPSAKSSATKNLPKDPNKRMHVSRSRDAARKNPHCKTPPPSVIPKKKPTAKERKAAAAATKKEPVKKAPVKTTKSTPKAASSKKPVGVKRQAEKAAKNQKAVAAKKAKSVPPTKKPSPVKKD